MTALPILFVVGTRPEAIKIGPVVLAARQHDALDPVLLASGQHREPVVQALAPFGLTPDVMLDLHRETGSLTELASLLFPALDRQMEAIDPAVCVVHGDTITASVAALVAFWRRIPVVHVEAGLRTGNLAAPFPEEGNRLIIDHLCALHLAPTDDAAANLRAEGIAGGHVLVTGNTVVDAIQYVAAQDLPYSDPRLRTLDHSDRRTVVVTVHRRESWGSPMRRILGAVRELAVAHPDIDIVLPAHPNKDVRRLVEQELGETDRVLICDPLSYPDMARLLSRAGLVLTDSGGIQEEAPSFGAPVLVLRDTTERPEAVAAGVARLVGSDPDRILTEASSVLASSGTLLPTPQSNPFGDGQAAHRSAQAIAWLLDRDVAPTAFGVKPALAAAAD